MFRMKSKLIGLTLIELLVVIALVSILASFAVPNLTGWNCRQNTEKDFINLASTVTYIKGLAMDRNQTMKLRSQGTGKNRNYLFYESPANSVTKKTVCSSSSWVGHPNEEIKLEGTVVSESSQVTCFHSDGSVNDGKSNVVWRVGQVCDGKRYDYQLHVYGSTGFVEKMKYDSLKKQWVDF